MAYAENFYMFSLAGGVAPRYQGSRDYRPFVAPLIAAEFSNGIFLSPMDGLGYKRTFANGMFASAALSYDFGRTDRNRADLPGSDYLKGMGRIPGSVMLSVQVGAHLFGPSTISITLDQPVTNTSHGTSGHVDLTVPVLQSVDNEISIKGSVHAGSGRYTQTFFGVTDAQAAASRFQPYAVKGGFDSAKVSVALDVHVFAALVGAYRRRRDAAARCIGEQSDRAVEEQLLRDLGADVSVLMRLLLIGCPDRRFDDLTSPARSSRCLHGKPLCPTPGRTAWCRRRARRRWASTVCC